MNKPSDDADVIDIEEEVVSPRAGLRESDWVTIRLSRRYAAMTALDLTAYGKLAGTAATYAVAALLSRAANAPVDDPVIQPSVVDTIEAWLLERANGMRTYGGMTVSPKFTRGMLEDLARRLSALPT